jgi:hypothetical protein
MSKTKFTYKTEVVNKEVIRYRCWVESFEDEGTDKIVTIKRRVPIKLNGQKLTWYPLSAIRRTSPPPATKEQYLAERENRGVVSDYKCNVCSGAKVFK